MKNIRNLRISKKLLALVAAGTVVLTFTGCNTEGESLLDRTILENTQVVTFEDGHKDLAVIKTWCPENYEEEKDVHNIYKSIISGEHFACEECTQVKTSAASIGYSEKINKCPILTSESIVEYLTSEEIVKANNDELTDEDINNIIARIFSEAEKESEKTK